MSTGMSFSKAIGFVQPQCTSHKIWLDATELDVVFLCFALFRSTGGVRNILLTYIRCELLS